MSLRFTTLASGSRGNVALVDVDDRRLLIDCGLAARTLKGRLGQLGLKVGDITEVVLTHTHGDHANDTALALLAENGIWFWCHAGHERELGHKPGFQQLKQLGLVLHYDEKPFQSICGLRVAPVALRHGPGKTFGFRLEAVEKANQAQARIGYFADLGCWDDRVMRHFLDCQLLAMEFNHDVPMTLASGRHPAIIQRNLSDDGHLSNVQAAELLGLILENSGHVALQHLLLLHISDQCNTPELAQAAAERVLGKMQMEHVLARPALQNEPLEWFEIPFQQLPPAEPGPIAIVESVVHKLSVGRSKRGRVLTGQQEFQFMVS